MAGQASAEAEEMESSTWRSVVGLGVAWRVAGLKKALNEGSIADATTHGVSAPLDGWCSGLHARSSAWDPSSGVAGKLGAKRICGFGP